MKIRKSTFSDLPEIMSIFAQARKTIAALGINQWQNGYPEEEIISADIEKGESYAVEIGGRAVGTFVMILSGEPTYDKIYDGAWKSGNGNRSYLAIHRVAISVSSRGSGISGEIIKYAEKFASENQKNSIRIDTHEGNVVMRRMLEKQGFSYCGVIYLESGEARVAYEKLI
ncbi:MAG: GNAT family N-acetyltransferase [Clostridia bacterium]|nr:GNAT family N-acetyltransferase [Clostridia bacterium]